MNSSSRVNPVFEECKKQRIGLMIFRIIYILVWIIAVVVLFDHVDSISGQVFGLAMGFFACLALLDVYAMQAIKQKENEAREQERNYMMRIVQDKKNKARREAQNIIVAEWEALCKAAGGLPTIESSFPCKRGEGVLHTESNVRLQETRKIRGPGGVSNDQWTTLDTGTFHVTNQRLVFLGNSGNRNIAINDIIAMKAFVDSFDVTSGKRAKPMGFLCDNPALLMTIVGFVQENPDLKLVPKAEIPTEGARDADSEEPHSTTESHPTRMPNISFDDEDEELIRRALKDIAMRKRASTSTLMRQLKIDYAKAARIMNILEERGYIGPALGAKPRAILFDTESFDWDSFQNEDSCHRVIPISDGYLELVKDSAEELGSFLGELSTDEEVESLLNRIDGIDSEETLRLFSTPNPLCGFLVAEDVLKCVKGLGYDLSDLGAAESAGIWFALSQVVDFKKAPIADWNDWKQREEMRFMVTSFAKQLQEAVPNVFDGDEFLFNYVLSNGDDSKGNGKRFATLMYRWASIVAKADGFVTSEESEFLAKIVKMGGVTGATAVSVGKVKADPALSKPLRDLEKMVGLGPVKSEVEKLANLVKIQQAREQSGIMAIQVSYHCVFTGNPGTGKTTVARIVAGIYKDLGVLKKGHLVETDRAGLVAEYVGQTGPKTNKVIDSALDGVLFIDEAYSLVEGGKNDYGKEAIATLLKRMEDDRSRLVVILAGYSENMKQFIASNPGLQSRFNRYIEFPDYEADDLVEIFKRFANASQYRLGSGTEEVLRRVMEEAVAHKDEQFGNGRFARNVFEKTIERQAMRLAGVGNLTKEMLQELVPGDVATT